MGRVSDLIAVMVIVNNSECLFNIANSLDPICHGISSQHDSADRSQPPGKLFHRKMVMIQTCTKECLGFTTQYLETWISR